MRSILRVGLFSLSGLLFSVLPLSAQRVSGEIVLVQGPVAARIEVGDRAGSYRPRREVIVRSREVDRGPRVVVVERRHVPRGRARGWWRHQGYQRAVVWVDDEGRYYDRDYDRDRDSSYDRDRDADRDRDEHRGLRPVNVYERDGQYYDQDD